jgi:hypothetical protein
MTIVWVLLAGVLFLVVATAGYTRWRDRGAVLGRGGSTTSDLDPQVTLGREVAAYQRSQENRQGGSA